MTINYSIDASKRLVNYFVEGRPTVEEFREFLDLVTAEPSFVRGFSFLGDCRGLTSDPEPPMVRAVASQFRAMANQLGPCKWALVSQTAEGFAAVRVTSLLTYGTGIEFAPFLKPDEAAKWLGVECAELKSVGERPKPAERHIDYLLDLRRRPGSGLHPRVMRKAQ
jgi:hypothetical protein